jgi:hypothetical protein
MPHFCTKVVKKEIKEDILKNKYLKIANPFVGTGIVFLPLNSLKGTFFLSELGFISIACYIVLCGASAPLGAGLPHRINIFRVNIELLWSSGWGVAFFTPSYGFALQGVIKIEVR